jgi:mannose-1-phosphate guanylyltransferase
MRHAVIMAGGAGTRLWPLSRATRPKQLLKLFGGTSLLREAYARVAWLVPPESIYIITNQKHLGLISEQLPELPAENLIGEPQGRDTANAVGLAAAVLHQRDTNAVMGIFTADHIITPIEKFVAAVGSAFTMAEKHVDALVTMGIRPTGPETGFGYVKRAAKVSDGVYEVERFTEKPKRPQAEEYVASGEYYWNSGMFAWRAETILGQLQEHLPESHAALSEIAAVWDTPRRDDKLGAIFPTLKKISIDFAVMEHAPRVLVVEMDCNWVDVGSWTALEAVLGTDDDGNVLAADRSVNLGSRGNVLVSEGDHLIATIGVEDLVIVHSPDATLVCKRSEAQAIKDMVAKVGERYGGEYR